jgi:hypothetical protein
VHELGHTPDAVSTHLRFASIGVEHPHTSIGPIGGQDQDHAITTDSETSVGEFDSESLKVFRERLCEAFDVDVVVPGAVHFGEC